MKSESLPAHVQALLNEKVYSHAADNIQLIQTHISWVILTGPYAYKLKKPRDFGFLNFSTLERRKHFCDMELELNRRLAPAMYLDVLPISHSKAGFTLGGYGSVIDYCIKMRQFDADALLVDQIEKADFNPACMDQLAIDIANFHAAYPYPGELGDRGSPDMLQQHILDNIEAGRVVANANTRLLDTLEKLEKMNRQAIKAIGPELKRRQTSGFIRQCHGDLHLKNIAMVDGKAMVFDCIEFNDDYRIIDVMNDVAFLVMDCDARGRADLGLRFLSRYLEQSGDYQGVRLLKLYAGYRGSVRGKVASLLSLEPSLNHGEKEQQIIEASIYFGLALDYTCERQPRLFAVGGFSGSGKSHLALRGCGPEKAIVIRSDATRKRLASSHPELPLYGEAINNLTYQSIFDAAKHILDSGYSVILDATFLESGQRDQFRALANQTNTPAHFLWLDIPESILRQRIAARQSENTDISDASSKILSQQLSRYQTPADEDIIFLNSSDDWPSFNPAA